MPSQSDSDQRVHKLGGIFTLRNALLTLGGLAVILILFLLSGLKTADLWRGITSVPFWVFLSIAVAQAIILLIAALKWRIILEKLPGSEKTLPLRDALAATTWGALAGQVLPIQLVTPPIRAWVARKHDISASRAIGTSIFEQVFEVLILAVMAAMSVLIVIFSFNLTTTLAVTLVLAILATFMVRPGLRLLAQILSVVSGLTQNVITALLGKIAGAAKDASDLPQSTLFQLTSFSFVRYALLAGLNVWILMLVAPSVEPLALVFAYPLILLVISLPFVPGGLGVVELTWVGVLVGAGLSTPQAVEAALVVRIVSTLAFLLAVPVLVSFQTKS